MKFLMVCGLTLAVAVAASAGDEASAREQMQLGVKAAQRGYWQEAEFRFRRALEGEAPDARALNNLAVAQEALGRYEDALATYKRALEIDPRDTHVKRNYARFAEFFASYARGAKVKEEPDANR